jgi:6-pyruvoyltetrahydropterin/6-carboxytetrahydropterin synthase
VIRVTRRYGFSAAHVLARPDWDDARNHEVYGKCANPSGHGHNYLLEITVRGPLDPATGKVIPLAVFDRAVEEHVLQLLDHRFLNREVAAFEKRVPTAENIAQFVWAALRGRLSPAVLDRIRLVETENNAVEYAGEGLGA